MTGPSRRRLVVIALASAVGWLLASMSGEDDSTADARSSSQAEGRPDAPHDGTSPAGCWSVVIELPWPVGETPGELCLVRDDADWSGKMFLKEQWRVLQSLHVSESTVRFTIDAPGGEASFDLRFDGDGLRGTANGRLGERPFSATRK